MTVSIAAMNPDNYQVGKGKVYFKPEGAPGVITDYPVGNVTELELTPNVDKLDHFSSMSGTRSKDKSIVIEKGYELRMVMEEWIPSNLQIALMGTVDDSNLAAVAITIGDQNSIEGQLRYVGENDVGPQWTFDFPEVSFSPSGSINPISDEWGNMEVTGEVIVQGDGTFGTATADFSAGAAVPVNTIPPTIYGTAALASTLTALRGSWTGSPTVYAYQWQRDAGAGFINIVGATSPTYLVAAPVASGNAIRVQVTATNTVGASAAANSAKTANVP